ncbi:MAG: protein-glutamate O-methyltransferase [Fibrobacterota bacterium]
MHASEPQSNIAVNDKDIELSEQEFGLISKLVYERCGISLPPHKKVLVKSRLGKRLRSLEFTSFKRYYEYVVGDESEKELVEMLDAVSTNVTQFFRENLHFDFLRDNVIPCLKEDVKTGECDKIRIWCAACSTGEEAYSLAITFFEQWPEITSHDFMILGTDISTHVLKIAEQAVYDEEKMASIPPNIRLKYFERTGGLYRVKDFVRKKILFRRLNLVSNDFPFKNPINVIFCRNVLIYFDKPTQQGVIRKFHQYLAEDGYLFLGHSEGLTGVQHDFKYVKPSIYSK